nr:uncharacterized protein LOC123745523 isoform X2 [Procambarus clarkii]
MGDDGHSTYTANKMGEQGGKKGKSIDPDVIRFEERARNLERAAQDMQKMLQKIASEKSASSTSPERSASKKNKGNRGSKSMMNLSSDESNKQSKEFRGRGRRGNSPQHPGHRQNAPQHPGHRQNAGLLGRAPPYQDGSQFGFGLHHGMMPQGPPPNYYPSHQSPSDYQGQINPPQYVPYSGSGGYNQPPPSYEEANRQNHSSKSKNRNTTGLTPEALVKAIVMFDGQWSTSDTLSRQVQKSEQEIAMVVKSRKDLFSFVEKDRGLVIELVPKLVLCSQHLSENGCLSRDSCKDLHMCKTFVTAFCDAGASCQYGHRWDTNHNTPILSKLYLDLIDKRVLHQVMRKVCKGNASIICAFYNSKNGCKKNEKCGFIHICKDYVMNCGKCSISDCSLNHDILTDHCKKLLKRFGISINESPRDILINLMSQIQRQEDQSSTGSSGTKIEGKVEKDKKCVEKKSKDKDSDQSSTAPEKTKSGTKKKDKKSDGRSKPMDDSQDDEQSPVSPRKTKTGGKHKGKKSSVNKSEDKENNGDSDQAVSGKTSGKDKSGGKKKKGKKANDSSKGDDSEDSSSSDSDAHSQHSHDRSQVKNKKVVGDDSSKSKRKKRTTYYSSDVCGDVQVPEICLFAVNDKCINAKKGCKYLHAKSLFHWQFERNDKWYNFRIFQSKALENAYRDVSKGSIQIPSLDPSKLESNAKELLNILGTELWTANFKDMTMNDSSGSAQLKIRRISTRSAGDFDNPKSTVYEWYFIDEQGKWISYGQADSLGNQELVCNVTCEDIEKQYLSDPSSSMVISNSQYKYCLNFAQMTQTNLKTSKVREIRRRPSRLSYQKKSSSSDQTSVPNNWLVMGGNQTHVLVPLDPGNKEYQEVASRLRLTLPNANVQKIERLQNPYLWRLLQYKKASLSSRYDDNQLNIQRLFHGTDPDKIDTICKENIDWRQGSTIQQNFGKGTYFSNSAAVARNHSTLTLSGHYVLILADVIIGSVVRGSPTLTRPPTNISTNLLYDTTVDDEHAPTIFVKYDKEEYYPEYIIEFF